MERGSAKHAPRIDEAIKQRTEPLERGTGESRVEEARMEEGWSDGERVVDGAARVEERRPGDVRVSTDVADLRAEIARSLERVIFPAGRDALVEDAVERQAPTRIIELLQSLPDTKVFENVGQIWEALGGTGERRF